MGVMVRAFISALLFPALLLCGAGTPGCASSDELPRIAAASSLQSVLPALIAQWGGEVEVTYGASGTLQRQIELGAPVEAVVFAALAPLADLEGRGLMRPESRRLLARNQLVLVGADTLPPLSWRSLGGLADHQRFSMGDPSFVPAGSYAREALQRLGVWESARRHAVYTRDVSAALVLARSGEVVGAIVYATDLEGASDTVLRVSPLPADQEGALRPGVFAGLSGSASRSASELIEFLGSERAAPTWQRHGFTPAAGEPEPSSGGVADGAIAKAGLAPGGERGFPIVLSLKVALLSLLLVGPPGIALAWFQARHRYPLRGAVDALVLLPLVLPPTVVGYFLVSMLGTRGPLGGILEQSFALRIIFSPTAAVIASAVVALPLLVKTAQPAIEAVSPELEMVGASLGLGPMALFFRVTLPLAWRGILAGLVLAWARGLGEFGATLMFAGHIPGRTNTMPLAIYAAYQRGDTDSAILYVAVLSILSLAVVLLASRFAPGRPT
jgi:molybdate transport system permease protein